MATEVIHTVGSGGHYSSLVAWEAAQQRDLTLATGDDTIAVAEVIGGTNVGNLTGRVDFLGWTTTKTNRVVVRAQAGSAYTGTGTLNTSEAYMQGNPGGNNGLLFPRCDILVQGIQVDCAMTGTSKCLYSLFGANSVSIDSCLLISTQATPADASNQEGPIFEVIGPNDICEFTNNIFIYNANGATGPLNTCFIQSTALSALTHTFYNNTVIVNDKPSGTCILLSIRNADTWDSNNNYFSRSVESSTIYNDILLATINRGANDATSNAEAITASLRNVPYNTDTFTNVTVGTENLTPNYNGLLFDTGADLTAQGITTDMIGTTRPLGAGYDIGALEQEDFPLVAEFSPLGKSIFVDASGNLLTSSNQASAPYIYAFGQEGNPMATDLNGMLLTKLVTQEYSEQSQTNTTRFPTSNFDNGDSLHIQSDRASSTFWFLQGILVGSKQYNLIVHQNSGFGGGINFVSTTRHPGGVNPYSPIGSGEVHWGELHYSIQDGKYYTITGKDYS